MRRALVLAALLVVGIVSSPSAAALPPTWTPTLVAVAWHAVGVAACVAQDAEELAGLGPGCPSAG